MGIVSGLVYVVSLAITALFIVDDPSIQVSPKNAAGHTDRPSKSPNKRFCGGRYSA